MPSRDLSPGPRARSARAAGVVLVAFAALGLAQCERQAESEAPPPAPAPAPAETPRVVIAPNPPLDRTALLSALTEAASRYAAGTPTPATARALVGRPFQIRLPFGCAGPRAAPQADGSDGLARWSWGEDRETIRLSLTPGDWTGSALIASAAGEETWEAVEGFWLPRPWLASDACPTVRPDPLQSGTQAASPQTAGLAALFETGSSRIGRRSGRAYSHVIRSEGDAPLAPPENGYRLLLEGRIRAFPDGDPIRCRASGPDQRPVCIFAVDMDRVGFETADGAQLSEWRR